MLTWFLIHMKHDDKLQPSFLSRNFKVRMMLRLYVISHRFRRLKKLMWRFSWLEIRVDAQLFKVSDPWIYSLIRKLYNKSGRSQHDFTNWFVHYSFQALSLTLRPSAIFVFLDLKWLYVDRRVQLRRTNIGTNDCVTSYKEIEAAVTQRSPAPLLHITSTPF